jgi:hypothetical protein
MQLQATGRYPSGLDDGSADRRKATNNNNSSSKKRKRGATDETVSGDGGGGGGGGGADAFPVERGTAATTAPPAPPSTLPRIQPGEKMSDFSARVDAALPMTGVARNKKGAKLAGVAGAGRAAQTRLEKKMQRMQAEWRREEKIIRQKRRERMEELLDECAAAAGGDDDYDVANAALLDQWAAGGRDDEGDEAEAEAEGGGEEGEGGAGRRKRRKRSKGRGKAAKQKRREEDDDPWEVIRLARNEQPRGLHDVVQAPPKITRTPRAVFGIANGARVDVGDVPKHAGSLRRREELGAARKSVLERYRSMMEGKRSGTTPDWSALVAHY